MADRERSAAWRARLGYLDRAMARRAEAPGAAEAVQEPGEAAAAGGSRGGPFAAPSWEPAGEYTFRRCMRLPDLLRGSRLSELLLPPGYAPEDLLFFDTETTGLSGGAGNLAFLVGLAGIEDGELYLEQLFLRDFPGEKEYLALVEQRLRRRRLFVSYNGRAFDAHVLQARFLLNRMALSLERQEDLLYWVRRLWRRRLADCSLGTVEREVLGVCREADVPGYEVPAIYLAYLRTGEPGRLEQVLEHNLQDTLALVRLFAAINGVLEEGRTPEALDGVDAAALGGYLLGQGRRRGAEVLAAAFGLGDELAGRRLSLYYKRGGDWDRAEAVWREMLRRRRSYFAGVELAKYLEHRRRDPLQALRWVREMLGWGPPLDPGVRRDLARRRERLEGRVARSRSASRATAGSS
jgi:uncharacterized protein YprB with RNaseH-like and TPR domain